MSSTTYKIAQHRQKHKSNFEIEFAMNCYCADATVRSRAQRLDATRDRKREMRVRARGKMEISIGREINSYIMESTIQKQSKFTHIINSLISMRSLSFAAARQQPTYTIYVYVDFNLTHKDSSDCV